MTRREAEEKLLALAEQMREVYLEYNPAGDFLTATIDANGYTDVSDCVFSAYGGIVMDARDRTFRTVDVTKHSDGSVRYSGAAKEGAA